MAENIALYQFHAAACPRTSPRSSPGTGTSNVTNGPKAVYPDEAIQAHLAFLTRRRALRPSEEYRIPTDEEWTDFLGHFELRKVATGTCGRAFGTPCIHEHSCLRCSMHWPSPAQRPRIAEIHDNLIARIAEAEREGWHGEAEGLKISLAWRPRQARPDKTGHSAPAGPSHHRHARPHLRSATNRRTEVNPTSADQEDHFKFRESAGWP